MSTKPPAEENIGPYYMVLGLACVGALVWLLHGKTTATSWTDVAVYAILALLALAFTRNKSFDAIMRWVATRLPTKYGAGTPTGEGGGKAE